MPSIHFHQGLDNVKVDLPDADSAVLEHRVLEDGTEGKSSTAALGPDVRGSPPDHWAIHPWCSFPSRKETTTTLHMI